ncbi:helix-turn-helix domain-containing protein [Pseudobutyrivibrio sp. 49]|uniref:helix-turn-helix domain-containing protein n=1 Tax=Pseudobutyrivibrio sp. 49 TaxID=1855344 RepID=UPI000B7FCB26
MKVLYQSYIICIINSKGRGLLIIHVNKQEVGANLRRLRKKNKLKADDVARQLNLKNFESIYHYEQGQTDPPGSTLIKMMHIYHCRDINELSVPREEDNE